MTTPAPSNPPAAAPPPVDPRLAASIDHWKRNLLDLTKRNRALNFRMNRVSTVRIVDEQPAEVFRQLCVEGASLRFRAAEKEAGGQGSRGAGGQGSTGEGEDEQDGQAEAPAQGKGAEAAAGSSTTPDTAMPPSPVAGRPSSVADFPSPVVRPPSSDDDDLPALDFTPYDRAALDERYADKVLQTAASAEQLDRSLRRLDEQARSTLEEQGVNALFLALGMLHYTEAPSSSEVFRAPLVLVPVELSRKSARAGYTVRATDDDPLVNPALAEYLRRWHQLALPELPDSAAMPEDYDLQHFLTEAADLIANQRGWSIKTEIYLGLFAFQKLVMYKDLEANTPAFSQHRLIRQLVTRQGAGAETLGLPQAVRDLELDRDYPPEQTFQVVDADSSQVRALAAVASNYDLVIEGPPGTGKSQTITNLIAQALAAGKSVLFVAEKMAALQVVYRRLVAAGLGEFCLELHSTKANKRAVMRQLAAALDASLQRPAVPTQSTQRLPQVRHSLSEYADAVHAPFGALQVSPYRAYGELGAVLDAPRLKYSGPADSVTREQLEQTVRDLDDLAAAAQAIGNPAEHPWRETTRTLYTEDDLENIRALALDLAAKVEALLPRGAEVAAALGLGPIRSFAEVEAAAQIALALARSPGAPLAVVQSEVWNTAPPLAVQLVQRGRRLAQLRQHLLQRFTPAVFEQDHAADIAYVEQKTAGALGFAAVLDGRFRAIRRRWLAYRLPAYRGSLRQQAQDLRRADEARGEQRFLASAEAQARHLFGPLWQGEASNWDALESFMQWIVELRALVVRYRLGGRTLELAAQRAPNVSIAFGLREAADAALKVLADLRLATGAPADYLQPIPATHFQGDGAGGWETAIERLRALSGSLALGPRWAAFEANRARAAQGLAAEVLPPAMAGEAPFDRLRPAFLRAFYQKWLAQAVQARAPLSLFHTLSHEQRIAEFRELDQRVLLENRAALVARLRDQVQQRLRQEPASAGMPYLRREMARQRNLSPLRATLRHAEAAIRAIKPCFMMSPLSVAQLLDGAQPSFDLVIFDEASQLPPEDAVGAIIRGAQLIVVGDPKQLPPTNFFTVMGGQVTAPVGEDGLPLFEDGESVLEEYLGAGLPASRLKWHYRSTHESLIAFSNVSFYDADLYTFPSVQTGDRTAGVQFEYVADGVYEGQGLNRAEARRVADAVVEHARQHPERSLGVGTFNLRQQLAIQDELEQRRRQDPGLEPFFAQEDDRKFFVKNLENIQGDERDVIFISVTYAKSPDGRVRYNFGPLNQQNGWRRLNVLTTRARTQMRVFASIHGLDLSPQPPVPLGAKLLREFLVYAETGRLASSAARAAGQVESLFEQDVYDTLTRRGLHLAPQVGVSGYRIDFGVLDPAVPGRYVCGLECDGVAYHASETARDRDRLRQQVLEARGWTIFRIWSTDWFKDRAGQVERLVELVAKATEAGGSRAEAGGLRLEAGRGEAEKRGAGGEEGGAAAAAGGGEAEAGSDALGASGGSALHARSGDAFGGSALHARSEPSSSVIRRPSSASHAKPYRVTPGAGRYAGSELLRAPAAQLQRAVTAVVEAEAPLHFSDLAARVAGLWDTRAGARILARIQEACALAERDGLLRRRGEFVYGPSQAVEVRSRAGTHIPPERVAPEEYREAVLRLLRGGESYTRQALTAEVRDLLGYGRASPALEAAVAAQVDALLAEGLAGEASAGIALRR